jgi:hypothetical protein
MPGEYSTAGQLFCIFQSFGILFFLNGFKRFLFDIFPGISWFRHHSPLFELNEYLFPAQADFIYFKASSSNQITAGNRSGLLPAINKYFPT